MARNDTSESEELPVLMPILRFQVVDEFCVLALMASSDVDQKYLGRLARETEDDHPFLASMLFKVLGLSVLLSKKLVRARRLRRLDTTRDTKSLQLYHRIIWLSREGLVITEQYILPMADDKHVELKVLATKLRASFYHIFVLFHNQPSIHQVVVPTYSVPVNKESSLQSSPDPLQGRPVQTSLPPGLAPISIPKPSGNFLLPAIDYIPTASSCFADAAALAEDTLPGSHPLRASVKVEYAAYLYDCLRDGEGSRRLAKTSLQDVYTDENGMDDDMFEETAKLVVILDKMARRGLPHGHSSSGSGGRGSVNTTPSTPRAPFATGAHPSMPSPASRRSPAEQRTTHERRSPPVRRNFPEMQGLERKRSPSDKPSPPKKRSSHDGKEYTTERKSEEQRTPKDKRGSGERNSSSERKGSGEHRVSGERKRSSERKGSGEHRVSGERKRSSERKGSGEHRVSGERKRSSERKASGEHRTSGERRSTAERKSSGEQRGSMERRSSGERKKSSERRSPSEEKLRIERRSSGERSPEEHRNSKEEQRSWTRRSFEENHISSEKKGSSTRETVAGRGEKRHSSRERDSIHSKRRAEDHRSSPSEHRSSRQNRVRN